MGDSDPFTMTGLHHPVVRMGYKWREGPVRTEILPSWRSNGLAMVESPSNVAF